MINLNGEIYPRGRTGEFLGMLPFDPGDSKLVVVFSNPS
jgi:hypothetical protein